MDWQLNVAQVLRFVENDKEIKESGKAIKSNRFIFRRHLFSFWLINLQGASKVHFQDLNAETIRCTTIPNVLANLEQARDKQSLQPESPLTPSRQTLAPSVHFYAGDWKELPTVLSVVRSDGFEGTAGMNLSFSEEDFMDGCSSQDGSITGQESSSRQSRKLSGSRAWERASETDQGEGGYDIILMTDIPYSSTSLKKLYALIKKVSFWTLVNFFFLFPSFVGRSIPSNVFLWKHRFCIYAFTLPLWEYRIWMNLHIKTIK